MNKSYVRSTKRKKWGRNQRRRILIFLTIGIISSIVVISQLPKSPRRSIASLSSPIEPIPVAPSSTGPLIRFQPSNREDFSALLEIGQKIEAAILNAKHPGTKVFTPCAPESGGYSILVISNESLSTLPPPDSKSKLAREAWLISTVTAAGLVTRDSPLPFKDLIVTDREAFKNLKGYAIPMSCARDLQRLLMEGQIDRLEAYSRIESAMTACPIEKKQMARNRSLHPRS